MGAEDNSCSTVEGTRETGLVIVSGTAMEDAPHPLIYPTPAGKLGDPQFLFLNMIIVLQQYPPLPPSILLHQENK